MTFACAGSASNAAANGAPAKQPLCFIVIPPRRRPSESGAALHRHRVFSSRVVSPAGIYRHQWVRTRSVKALQSAPAKGKLPVSADRTAGDKIGRAAWREKV